MALADDIRRLARIPLLAQMEQDALRLIAFSGESKIYRKGDVVFNAGDKSDGGYVVLTGSIRLEAPGNEDTARVVGPDALIGETALIAPSIRPATATALEATTVLKISRSLFHRVLDEHPEYAAKMRLVVARRLSALTSELRTAESWRLDPEDTE